MSHESLPSKTEKPTAPPEGSKRWHIAKRLSALAMLGLSLAGTVAANTGDQPNPNNPSVSVTTQFGDTTVIGRIDGGMQDIVPAEQSVYLPGVRLGISNLATEAVHLPGSYTVERTTETEELSVAMRAQLMEWARMFDADPMAEQTLDAELGIKDALAKLEALQADGWTINDIVLHGYASDEDDTAWKKGGDNPGFGIDSKKNERLALKRARAVASLLRVRLRTSGNQSLVQEVRVDGGSEMQDDVQAKAITELAHSLGMSTQDLVVIYNRDRDSLKSLLTKEQLKILDGLRQDRFVSIKVEASKEVTHTSYVWIDGEWVEQKTTGKEFNIVLIPILIPIIRRASRKTIPDKTPPLEPIVPIIPLSRPPHRPTTVTYGPHKNRRRKSSQAPTNPGHGQIATRQKQPSQHNNNRGSGTRGQRSPYPLSGYMRNKARAN